MMQPAFLPWQGYFELIDEADTFVLCDDFQYEPQSWQRRNRLFVSRDRVDWYGVQIRARGCSRSPLSQVPIDGSERWRMQMWRRLEYNYHKAPYFEAVAPRVREWLFASYCSLAETNQAFIELACDMMGIKTRIRLSSQRASDTRRSERVCELLDWCGATTYLCAAGSFEYMESDGLFPACGTEVLFQDFCPRPYHQISSSQGFVPNLSVLDALLNVGPQATRELIRHGTTRWLSWEARNGHESREGAFPSR
jgi:hypothetical protein